MCKVQTHEKPYHRRTYAPHSVYGWYIRPALNIYNGYTLYNSETGRDNTPDTIALSPASTKNPNFSFRDMAIYGTAYLAKYFQTPRPESTFQVG